MTHPPASVEENRSFQTGVERRNRPPQARQTSVVTSTNSASPGCPEKGSRSAGAQYKAQSQDIADTLDSRHR
jgi:hypothetical protein